jgi:hypothetical protein
MDGHYFRIDLHSRKQALLSIDHNQRRFFGFIVGMNSAPRATGKRVTGRPSGQNEMISLSEVSSGCINA